MDDAGVRVEEGAGSSVGSAGGPPEDVERPVHEHVRELLVRLKRIVVAVGIAMAVSFLIPVDPRNPMITLAFKFPEWIVQLVVPKYIVVFGRKYTVYIMPESPFEVFDLLVMSALFLGIMGAMPVIVKEVWEYVRPALYPHEREMIKRYSVIAGVLFAVGALFTLFVIVPFAMRLTLMLYPFFVPEGYKLLLRFSVSQVVGFTLKAMLIAGVVFEIPLIIYALVVNCVLDPANFMGPKFKIGALLFIIVAMIFSPDPIGVTGLLFALLLLIPLWIAVKRGAAAYRRRCVSRGSSGGGGAGG